MPLPNCAVCNQPLNEGDSYMALVEDIETMKTEGGFWYKWEEGCMHHTVENPAIILGSANCARQWLHEHPEYIDSYIMHMMRRKPHVHTS